MSQVNLTNFTRAADQLPKNSNLTVGPVGIASTFSSARRATIDAFVDALRAEYGDRVADMCTQGLRGTSIPLTAGIVKDAIKLADMEKANVNAQNAATVEKFLSGADPAKSLDKALDAYCDKNHIGPEGRALLRPRVAQRLQEAAGAAFPKIATLDALFENLRSDMDSALGRPLADAAPFALGQEGRGLPGSLEDRLQLFDLGLSPGRGVLLSTLGRGVFALETMRLIQPEGPISRETAWRAMFNEPLPAGITSAADMGRMAQAKIDEQIAALAGGDPVKENAITVCMQFMPWENIVRSAARPGPLRLEDLPNPPTLNNVDDRPEARRCLERDSCRRGEFPRDWPKELRAGWRAPTYTIGAERIQVGDTTDFPFEGGRNGADSRAYRESRPNSLSRRLEASVAELCGYRPPLTAEAAQRMAGDRQLTSVLFCLGQCPLVRPMRYVAPLAGANFFGNEHANVSVSLERLENGSIRADFSSPDDAEARARLGHFSMSVEIRPDGEMITTAFEILPADEAAVALLAQERRDAAALRERQDAAVMELAAPLLADGAMRAEAGQMANDMIHMLNEAGVTAGAPQNPAIGRGIHAFAQHAETQMTRLAAAARATPARLENTLSQIDRPLRDLARRLNAQGAILNAATIREARYLMLGDFMNRLRTAVGEITAGQRGVFIQACLNAMDIPRGSLLPASAQLADSLANIMEALRDAKDRETVLSILGGVNTMIAGYEYVASEEDQGGDEMGTLQGLAVDMALQTLDARPGNPVRGLLQPGSAFRDVLHELDLNTRGYSRTVRTAPTAPTDPTAPTAPPPTADVLLLRVAPIIGRIATLRPDDVAGLNVRRLRLPESTLSLARQRELAGGDSLIRGVTPEAVLRGHRSIEEFTQARQRGEIPTFTEAGLRGERTAMEGALQNFFQTSLDAALRGEAGGNNIRAGGAPNDPAWNLTTQFGRDYHRVGITLDGRHYHGSDTPEANFLALFPDRRAGAIVSHFANQMFFAGLQIVPSSQSDGRALMSSLLPNPQLSGIDTQQMHIETLDAAAGRYRVSARLDRAAVDPPDPAMPAGAIGGYTLEGSIEVVVGDPAAPPPPTSPRVDNAHLDFIVRGREAVPGE